MGRGRQLARDFENTSGPPFFSNDIHTFALVTGMRDKGIVMVNIASELSPTPITTLAFLPPRFRNVIYIRRGSYLILSKIPDLSEEDLVQYTIEHPLRTLDIKQYKKDGIWPSIFERIIHMDIEEEEKEEEEEEEVFY